MHTDHALHDQVAFHLTGRQSGALAAETPGAALRPALFAGFHDLTRLRYDFPVVLLSGGDGEDAFRSLSDAANELLGRIAPPGPAGERLRRSVLRVEREIRQLLAAGRTGRLSELWRAAADRIVEAGGAEARADLDRAQAALKADGELLDCQRGTALQFVTHAWRAVEDARARKMRREIDALAVRLSGLVKADFLRSEAGRSAATLRAGVGTTHQALFDFDAMARLLARPSGASALGEARRRRIESALAVLGAQRFFAAEGGYNYRYDDVQEALRAFRERLPAMAELVRAIAIAELEVDGRYAEAQHDEAFRRYTPASLAARDMAIFPSYLVCARAGAAAQPTLIEALGSDAPLKILVESRELVEASLAGEDHASLGSRLAASAMGLGEAFVLQSASAHLYRARARLRAALQFDGAALVSVFAPDADGGLPPYLVAAAAMQSRAFPAFSYDPSAGSDWAQRFSLEDNPQPERSWPVHEFAYADDALQRVQETLPFTFAEFALCNPRLAGHFAEVPRAQWNGALVPVGEWLGATAGAGSRQLPCVYAVDAGQRLRKLVVDETLVRAAQRCAAAWRQLQELDGLKRAGAQAGVSAPAAASSASAPAAAPAPSTAPAPAPSTAAAPAAAEVARNPDEPYIETERCTSCNECTQINSALFVYNANKQAHIANPDAGTYRQLVEAAESCQVSIIHPGKPRNPKEPGLDELAKRAEPFL